MLDGVDGEMARATFRTTTGGATIDSAVDMATNFAFLLGFTINLWQRDGAVIGALGLWSIAAMIVGNYVIARRTRAGGAPLGYDLLKRSGRIERPIDLIYWVVQTLTGRDCFAFLFMALILAGLRVGGALHLRRRRGDLVALCADHVAASAARRLARRWMLDF